MDLPPAVWEGGRIADPAVIEPPYAEQVRELWTAWERHGLDAMLARLPADVEWVPLAGDGAVLRTHDELREFWARQQADGHREQVVAYRFEQVGEAVLVAGALRQFAPHGWADSQPVWVFFFSGGRLRRARGFRSRDEAARAAAAHNDA